MAFRHVSNQTQLSSALSSAAAGDTIVLASGNYGQLRTSNLVGGLTITSAPGATVQFDRVSISNSHDMTIRGVSIGSPLAAGEALWTRMAEFNGSRNLLIDNVAIAGSRDGNPQNDGVGIVMRNMDGATVRNSTFNDLGRGIQMMNSKDLVVLNNRFDTLEQDGVNGTAVQNVTVDGNSFTNFRPMAGAHPDAIQFYTGGQTVASSNIFIRNNVLLQGAGVGPQGIFMRDETGTLPYRNVVIENNLMYGADLWHGIAVSDVIGLRVAGNTVLSPNNDAERFWITVNHSQNVVVTKNFSDEVIVGTTNVNASVSDNISLRTDPAKASLIPNLNAGATATVADLTIVGHGYTATPSLGVSTIWGTTLNDTLTGSGGSDQIFGLAQNDTRLGRGSIDRMTGGAGNDHFMLGDFRGAFYNDGSATSSGRGDYAQILDFQVGVDTIQLAGQYSDYVFRAATLNNLAGLEIYMDTNRNGKFDSLDELIGHIASVSVANPEYFTFG